MIIGDKKLRNLKQMPNIETRVSKSKDGKWIINKTTITSIKPTQYFQAVISNEGDTELEVESEEMKQQLDSAKEAVKQ